ncbi:hypothetical protein SORBI_3008G126500 [Sorghum bicolor]|uniref:Uncharacterized protein n=1 Tax=Sorghum bicolor TaxID=4558 RepID=A0A1B6PDC1_SORBI|nr:hypothetical protein SORBI_3008G126500 [Sorghum bicolor]
MNSNLWSGFIYILHISFILNLPTPQNCERTVSTTIKSEKVHISFILNLPTPQKCERTLSTTIKSEKVYNLYMIEFLSFHTFSVADGAHGWVWINGEGLFSFLNINFLTSDISVMLCTEGRKTGRAC